MISRVVVVNICELFNCLPSRVVIGADDCGICFTH